jgi:hypothetical protein
VHMNVKIVTEAVQFLFCLFQIFGIVSLQ